MEYIISEEELIDYTFKVVDDDGKSLIGTLYKDFLKSKQPVELVAEGKIIIVSGDYINWSLNQNTEDNIKIYIQKVKE